MRPWLPLFVVLVGVAPAFTAACASDDARPASPSTAACDGGVCPGGAPTTAPPSTSETAADGGAAEAGGPLPDASAPGTLPAGLPTKLLVGLFEDGGGTWMKSSGVPWNARYRYIVKGWANNFGFGARDGSFARSYFDECAAQGAVPAIAYYQVNGEPGGSEASFLQKTQNAATMAGYFADFKLLMERVKDFGKPVLVLLEPDGTGLLQLQANGNPATAAAVASTGLPELAGLPDTIAGWGLAFLRMKKAVGASNAILGLHVSAWASGKDLSYYSVTDPLDPEVTKVHDFLAPLGLAANTTGLTYDVLVGDPLDRDSDYYRIVRNDPNRWWDASDAAPVGSRSFNRYAEWLRLWNVKTQKRWVLWQIPLGNSNHLNVSNEGASRQGYKDNRPEYFFGPGRAAHLQRFAASGVIALLFGAGAGGVSSYQNDTFTDGKPFMQSRVGEFFAAGGLAITP